MASFFSTTSGVGVIDTRTRPGTITLPLTSQIPNRYLQIKDLYGAFGRSSLTISTQSGESFDDGTTSKVFTDPFTFFTLYAASTTKWAQLGGTQTVQQTISSLNVSSITIGTGLGWLQLPPVQTIALSTNAIIGDSLTVNSTTSYYISAQILYVSSIMGAVVTGGGGTGDVTKANLLSTTANLQSAATQFVSSLTINTLTIGSGAGWLQLPPIQTIYASTTYTQAQSLIVVSSYFGSVSTLNTLDFYGLFGNYNNTVLAEVSTGAGTQEFLVFKGSSSSDRIRFQTTGNFVVETGVSARLWDDTTIRTLSNATPAFIINTSSNVGIQTASPGATLDVAGTGRAVTFSSQQLFVSSFNGDIPIVRSNEISTVRGLGSSGYISSIPAVLGTSTFTASTIATSSLQVNSLTIGTGTGWVNLGPLQTIYISSFQDTTNALYAANAYIGITSTVNALTYNGLFGNYNNTALAEISTGAGTQELLLFKGSSTSDRVRVQTTGTFVIETGVSSRLWNPTIPTQSNATPAFIVNTSSNVGIQTASPGTALDVGGTARAVTVSSQQLFFSSVNGGLPLSVANLTSTTGGLQSNIQGWSQYPTTTDVTFATGTGVLPADLNSAFQIKANNLLLRDANGGYGYFSMGNSLSMNTSSTAESYSLGFSEIATGSVSSFVFTRYDGVTTETAPVYMSSIYLGNVGGTVAGQLTTDATATDLFWKGSKLNSQSGGGGGAIDYVSAFTVSTGSLEVSSISSYVIYTYGIVGSALFNVGPDPMAITTIPSGTITSLDDLTFSVTNSTIVNTNTFYVSSSNDITLASPQVITNSVRLSSLTLLDGNTGDPNGLSVSSGTLLYNTTPLTGIYPSNYVCQGRLTADETITANTDTVIPFVSDFDPQGWLANAGTSTARFQPTIAGYYIISYQVWWGTGSGANQDNIQIRKSGNTIAINQNAIPTVTGLSMNATKLTYLNGSTDYIDFSAYSSTSDPTQTIQYGGTTDGPGTFFSASLVTGGGGGGGGGLGDVTSANLISTVAGFENSFVTSSIQCSGTISTHSLVIYGPSTLTVQGLSYFQNIVSSASIVTGVLGVIDSVTGQPSYIQASNGSLDLNGGGALIDQPILNSTIQGLGTLGYISSGGGGGGGPYPSPFEIGTNASGSYLGFYGTDGTYTQSVVAEADLGGGNQELVLFRGSNASDRMRFQTTGPMLFETGVSSRVWPSAPSNATPAMVIDIASNVGIQTASPTTALDVAGTGRFLTMSSFQVQASSIVTNIFTTNIFAVGIQTL